MIGSGWENRTPAKRVKVFWTTIIRTRYKTRHLKKLIISQLRKPFRQKRYLGRSMGLEPILLIREIAVGAFMVEDVGFEPRFKLPKLACYHYTTSSILGIT